jgi:hypothetical protein
MAITLQRTGALTACLTPHVIGLSPVLSTSYLATGGDGQIFMSARRTPASAASAPLIFVGPGQHDRLLWLSLELFAACAVPSNMVKN